MRVVPAADWCSSREAGSRPASRCWILQLRNCTRVREFKGGHEVDFRGRINGIVGSIDGGVGAVICVYDTLLMTRSCEWCLRISSTDVSRDFLFPPDSPEFLTKSLSNSIVPSRPLPVPQLPTCVLPKGTMHYSNNITRPKWCRPPPQPPTSLAPNEALKSGGLGSVAYFETAASTYIFR